jgi:replicative DNA helicase
MSNTPDDNDKAQAGTLPADPFADTKRTQLRAVKPGEARTPPEPCDVPAERALLGAMLWAAQNAPERLRVRAVTDILDTGTPFYIKAHGDIYDAMRACLEEKAEHDTVAVHAALVRAGTDRSVGGMSTLQALQDQASTVSENQARVYAEKIRDAWARRMVIAEARALAEDAKAGKLPTETLIAQAQALTKAAAERSAQRASFVWLKDSVESLASRVLAGEKNPAISTGLSTIDDMLNGGLRPREVSVLAARLNVGKSLLAAQIAEHMVTDNEKYGVLYVTLEMPHEMFTARLLAAKSGVALGNVRRMVFNQTQMQDFMLAAQKAIPKRLAFADSPTQTLAAVYATASAVSRSLAREGRMLAMVVIDHIGLVKPSAEALKKANREQQVAETSRGQRLIANELGCHVMGIAQIGREAEKQSPGAMPRVHQLRESDGIGQDADTVLILHRERDKTTGIFCDKPPALALAKGRMDETGIILLELDRRGRFSNYTGTDAFGDLYK